MPIRPERLASRRASSRPIRDATLAVGLFAVSAGLHIAARPLAEDDAQLAQLFMLGLIATECGAFALRARSPRLALAVAFTALLTQRLLLPAPLQSGVGTAAAVYALAAARPNRTTVRVVVALAATDVAVLLLAAADELAILVPQRAPGAGGWAVPTLVAVALIAYALPCALGLYVGTHREYLLELEERARHLEREREEHARRATEEERARIARELHDVAAHHISAIVVLAGAAESQLPDDPALAAESMRLLRSQAREALRSMRFLVGVLRAGTEIEIGTEHGLAHLGRLVELCRDAGTAVDLHTELAGEPLSPVIDLAAYRIVQESLTNTATYAPGSSTAVHLCRESDQLHIRVENEGPTTPHPRAGDRPGYGLMGMRERAALLGGYFDAGPTPSGGWCVRATLPTSR